MPFKLSASIFSLLSVAVSAIAQDLPRPMPLIDQTNLPQQRIGREDLLGITVYNSPELTRTVRVGVDGNLRLPMLKSAIRAEGLMPVDVEASISEALKSEGLLVDPFVTVAVAEYHSRPISVNGAVKTPTIFQAIGSTSLLDALAKGGGPAPEAGGEIIVVRPGGATGVETTQKISLKSLLDGSDPSLNVKLVGGEEIRVPIAGTVVVSGNVKESGVFPVQENGTSTVLTAIGQAKGLGDFQPKMVYIFRTDDKGARREIAVDLKAIQNRKTPDVVLLPKDLLYVPNNNLAKNMNTVLTTLVPVGTAATSAAIYVLR